MARSTKLTPRDRAALRQMTDHLDKGLVHMVLVEATPAREIALRKAIALALEAIDG